MDQLKPGEDYQKLEKCIHVGILNFTLFDDEEYYSRFHFWSDQGRKMYSDKFEIHTLELPKLAKHEYPGDRAAEMASVYQCRDQGGI